MLDLTTTTQALILTIEAAAHATVQQPLRDLESEITTLKAALMGWRRKWGEDGFYASGAAEVSSCSFYGVRWEGVGKGGGEGGEVGGGGGGEGEEEVEKEEGRVKRR